MRDDDSMKKSQTSDDEQAGGRGDSRHRGARRRKRGANGAGPEMPFQMGNLMQMLPLLMAMGGGSMPGMNMAGTQIRMIMMAIEIWIDYLAAMQEFLECVLDRLAEFNDGGGLFGGGADGAEDGADW